MECTNGCVINSVVGGDHAYCACGCHEDTLPAVAPSRERTKKTAMEVLAEMEKDGAFEDANTREEYFKDWEFEMMGERRT